ncbi:hydroxyacylglutathione hydrolase [Ramlibacter sp. PS3R-8]|uniref:hydroxyacylglutathione hydrolase n=1 Tax=Ramlibacter sp. PS3R-8 TaxID=3133437 RepID=UPI0030AB9F47
MKLIPLPAFQDNYLWLLHDGRRALVVDPGEAGPVLAALEEGGLQLEAILVTHHHPDHVGGVDAVRDATGARVFGPARERIPEPLQRLSEGDAIDVLGLRFEVIDVPGHTAGHIAYYARDVDDSPLLFCGDTLFSGGCGRLFEGTAAQMHDSLAKLAALPGNTRVCCTHEYTLGNLKFATAVEPANSRLIHYRQQCELRRSHGEPTLPSTIATEREVNPFLRTRIPAVTQAAHAYNAADVKDEVAVFAALRQWKNEFR